MPSPLLVPCAFRAALVLLASVVASAACGPFPSPRGSDRPGRSDEEVRPRRARHRAWVAAGAQAPASARVAVREQSVAELSGFAMPRRGDVAPGLLRALHRPRDGTVIRLGGGGGRKSADGVTLFVDEVGLEFAFHEDAQGFCTIEWEVDDALHGVVADCDDPDAWFVAEDLDLGRGWLACDLDAFCTACDELLWCGLEDELACGPGGGCDAACLLDDTCLPGDAFDDGEFNDPRGLDGFGDDDPYDEGW